MLVFLWNLACRVDSGSLELCAEVFCLRSCIEGAIDVMLTAANSKGLEVAFSIPKDVPFHAVGDSFRLRQVCLNLLVSCLQQPWR